MESINSAVYCSDGAVCCHNCMRIFDISIYGIMIYYIEGNMPVGGVRYFCSIDCVRAYFR